MSDGDRILTFPNSRRSESSQAYKEQCKFVCFELPDSSLASRFLYQGQVVEIEVGGPIQEGRLVCVKVGSDFYIQYLTRNPDNSILLLLPDPLSAPMVLPPNTYEIVGPVAKVVTNLTPHQMYLQVEESDENLHLARALKTTVS
jgi:hypothetical protein